MPPAVVRKNIITGTGRAGTTFLVQLLTELGLDTGYTPATWPQDYDAHCAAGLERDIEDPSAPYIVKNPALSTALAGVLDRGHVTVDFAIIPIRRLEDAARSRIRIGGDGTVPGGLTGTADPAKQADVLAHQFHCLVETLARHAIPHVFLHFPRFARDADYAYSQLRPVLGSVDIDAFRAAFARLARPELIHSFAQSAPADTGEPARRYRSNQRRRRIWRLARRTALGAGLIGLGWIAAGIGDDDAADRREATLSPSLLARP